ncbi:phage tail assembly chaperone [Shinella sp.]|uniref:phage tail assembly chaperone n=2 Tax=Rhizobiaceae TaxID=82115 RepID=UPI0039E6CE5F
MDKPFPWREWMRLGIGGLGWRPDDFWSATLTEFFEAIRGFNDANGAGKSSDAPSDDELQALVSRYG